MNVCKCSDSPAVVTVGTIEGLKGLANTYAYVSETNSTYYISPCHEVTLVMSGPVFIDEYDAEKNALNLRSQLCFDFAAGYAYAFNALGEYRKIKLEKVV